MAVLGLLSLIGAASCAKSKLAGRVFLPVSQKQFKPAGLVQVLLIKGDLVADLKKMGKDLDAKIAADAAKMELPSLKKEQESKKVALATAEAALAQFDLPVPAGDVSCLTQAEAAMHDADARYAELLDHLAAELAALHIEEREPARVIAAAEAAQAARLEEHAARLRDEYLSREVPMQSHMVMEGGTGSGGKGRSQSGGSSWDKLCWSATNNGRLNVVGGDLFLSYNGQHVPYEIANRFWQITEPLESVAFVVRDSIGREVRGLPPGGMFELCFYARKRPSLPPEELTLAERYGLSNFSNSRSGNWVIGAENVVVTDAPAVKTDNRSTAPLEFEVRPLFDVFRAELAERRARLLETAVLEELTKSDIAVLREHALDALTTCRKVIDLGQEVVRVGEAVTALEQGQMGHPEVRRQLDALLQNMKNQQKSATVAKAVEIINERRVATRESAADGSFVFEEIPSGTYTLVASNKTPVVGKWVSWLAPIQMKQSLEQDLSPDVMHEGTLAEVIEAIIMASEPAAVVITPKKK